MAESFLITHKIKTKDDFLKYQADPTVYGKCIQAIKSLPYYQNHQFRKNGVLCIHIYMTAELLDNRVALWEQTNTQWAKEFFSDKSVIVSSSRSSNAGIHIHEIYLIPISPQGRVSYDYFCGSIQKLRFMQASYDDVMKYNFGLTRTKASIVKRSAKQDIYKSIGTMPALPDFNKYQDINECVSDIKLYLAQMQNYYEKQIEAAQTKGNKELSAANHALKKENIKLSGHIGPYIDFISEYGGLNKVRSMLSTAQLYQYAIRKYQENGDQSSIKTAIGILEDGQDYIKTHNISVQKK